MLLEFQDYLTFENIYLWTNLGILPFWLMLIVVPNSKITQFFVNSIILPLIFSSTIIYLLYQSILIGDPILNIIQIYFSLENLYTMFATDSFLLIFWINFVAINLFLGSWVSRDSLRYNISRKIVFIPLILIYFAGPVGLVLYWFFRVFYAKRISFHD